MHRRPILSGSLVALVALGWTLAWPGRPAATGSTHGVESARAERRVTVTASPPVADGSVEDAPATPVSAFRSAVDAVAADCGLGLQVTCADGPCVAVASLPDLDGMGGWLSLLATSPAFVVGTAARDLGLPPDALPCGDAVLAMSRAGGEATSVALPSGDEVWCAAPDGSPASRSACGRAAAAAFGADATAWTADVRVLRFDR